MTVECVCSVRNIIDFGLVVLIWLAQTVIYPSFEHIDAGDFRHWHQRYTHIISAFVVPLMCGQAAVIAYQVAVRAQVSDILSAALVVGCWTSTFTLSMQYHAALQKNGKQIDIIEKLVRSNWIRTILWSLVFALGYKPFIAT
jgi:hypothetical protein